MTLPAVDVLILQKLKPGVIVMQFNPTDSFQSNIIGSFSGPNNCFRTIGGISRDTGFPYNQVHGYITGHPDVFRHASLQPGGSDLYMLNPGFNNPLNNNNIW
jgi:hypothetical protein